MCGFNQKEAAYCPGYEGNPYYKKRVELIGEKATEDFTSKCHIETIMEHCHATHEWASSKEVELNQGLLSISNNLQDGLPLFADNSGCVKQTLTYRFWNVTSVYSMIAVLFALLCTQI